MSARGWVVALNAAVADFASTRRTIPVVRVTLPTGEARYLVRAEASKHDELLMLDMYPEGENVDDLLDVEGGDELLSKQRLLLRPSAIVKVEILYEHPRRRGEFGFHVEETSNSA